MRFLIRNLCSVSVLKFSLDWSLDRFRENWLHNICIRILIRSDLQCSVSNDIQGFFLSSVALFALQELVVNRRPVSFC